MSPIVVFEPCHDLGHPFILGEAILDPEFSSKEVKCSVTAAIMITLERLRHSEVEAAPLHATAL